jgi:RND family efflux transporter MFP subunit
MVGIECTSLEASVMVSLRRFRLLLAAFLVSAGCAKVESPAGETAPVAMVHWEEPKTGPLNQWVELLGTVQPLPEQAAQVSVPIGGQVVSILTKENGKRVAEGDEVKKNDVLLRLDDRVARANLEKLRAAEKELEESVKEAGLAVDIARLDVDRLEKLKSDTNVGGAPLVSRVELEKARLTLQEAEARERAARAKQGTARADCKALEEQLALYTVRAPIDGRIGAFHASVGGTLAAGTVVTEIIDLNKVDILCFAPAGIAGEIARGQRNLKGEQKALLLLPGIEPDHAPVGRVVFLAEQAQAETGNVAMKVRFDNSALDLRAGTLQKVAVQTDHKKDARWLPEDALLEDQDPPGVLVAIKQKEYKLTEKSFEALHEAKVPDDILDKLKPLQGREFESEEAFLQDLRTRLDPAELARFQKPLLKKAEIYMAKRYWAKVGLRDRYAKEHPWELLELADPEAKTAEDKKKPVPFDEHTLFITEGAHGLEDGDLVRHEEEKEEELKEPAGKDSDKKDDKKPESPKD